MVISRASFTMRVNNHAGARPPCRGSWAVPVLDLTSRLYGTAPAVGPGPPPRPADRQGFTAKNAEAGLAAFLKPKRLSALGELCGESVDDLDCRSLPLRMPSRIRRGGCSSGLQRRREVDQPRELGAVAVGIVAAVLAG